MEWREALLALLALATVNIARASDPYVSQISPNSIYDPHVKEDSRLLESSEEPSLQLVSLETNYNNLDHLENSDSTSHVVVRRSAAPILRDFDRSSSSFDSLSSLKNIDDSLDTNNVDILHKPRYYDIQPTKTQLADTLSGQMASSIIGTGEKLNLNQGEARGVLKGRTRSPKGPRNMQNVHQNRTNTASSIKYDAAGRQANPDIQDIITGIVKLLNGNVNVQANTQPANGRPGRPPNTRINNRGPPRISDVPPLPPDFDTPGPVGPGQLVPPTPPQTSTKIPPPYPFDRPPNHDQPPHRPFLNGIPLPEQIVPVMPNQNYRPNGGFVNGRPQNIPPWQRPRPRPSPNRRPNPNTQMYKPLPTVTGEPQTPFSSEESLTYNTPVDSASKPNNDIFGSQETIPENGSNGQEHETSDSKNETEQNNTNDDDTRVTVNESFLPDMTVSEEENLSFVRDRDPPTSHSPPKVTESNAVTIQSTEVQRKPEEPNKHQVLKDGENTEKKKLTMVKEKPSNNKKQDDKFKDTTKLGEDEAIKDVKNSLVFQPTSVLESSKVDISSSDFTTPQSNTSIPNVVTTTSAVPTKELTSVSSSIITNSTSTSSSTISIASTGLSGTSTLSGSPNPYKPYRPRPGIVLDDPEYRPGGKRPNGNSSSGASYPFQQHSGNRYNYHNRPGAGGGKGEIFDVTVSAIQGPGGGIGSATVHIENVNPLTGHSGDIIVSASGEHGFVSIDGKRTYLNLMGGDATPTQQYKPTSVVKPSSGITGTGFAVPEIESAAVSPDAASRPQPPRRPTHQPPVRIDTCIVGDDSTCDQTQNEKCKTEAGISSCQCRPGYARRNHRDPCRKVVAMVFSLRVDRMYDRKVSWDDKLSDKDSEPYHQLSYEAVRAVDSAFSMTPYSDEFVSGSVNTIYKGTKTDQGVFVNVTVLLEESSETKGGQDITRHLLGVIQRRSNNVGQSALWVDHTRGSISPVQDLDECSSPELNDCHELATCTNVWGSFKCSCPEEARDAWAEHPNKAGRNCHTCPTSHCSNRGTCTYRGGQPMCSCTGAYYGSQCEVDGEVVGVAVGASLAALLVILITLACLIMWSRRWSREQKNAPGIGSPVFGYMTGTKIPNMGHPPYQVSLEERMRWAQLADVMAQANHYAQPEPAQGHPGARPASAMYGAYPTLPAGTLPPVPRPRLGLHMGGSTMHLNAHTGTMNTMATGASRSNTLSGIGNAFSALSGMGSQQQLQHAESSSSSESDSRAPDRTDLLGTRGFHVPRPKSRSNTTNSIANQSGIYYDVDYENAPDPIYGTKGIPLSTYTMNRPSFYGQ